MPIQDVFDALQSTMGALYVNDFNKFGRTYRVQVQADAAYRATPDDLGNVYVRSATSDEMIPLKALVRIERTSWARTSSIASTASSPPRCWAAACPA